MGHPCKVSLSGLYSTESIKIQHNQPLWFDRFGVDKDESKNHKTLQNVILTMQASGSVNWAQIYLSVRSNGRVDPEQIPSVMLLTGAVIRFSSNAPVNK